MIINICKMCGEYTTLPCKGICKKCYNKIWYMKNKDKINKECRNRYHTDEEFKLLQQERQREYASTHREQERIRATEYYNEHKNERLEYINRYRLAIPNIIRDKKNAAYAAKDTFDFKGDRIQFTYRHKAPNGYHWHHIAYDFANPESLMVLRTHREHSMIHNPVGLPVTERGYSLID